jgi:hypothetical protein
VNDILFTTAQFTGEDMRRIELRSWQRNYEDLVAELGKLGTEVIVGRTIQTDSHRLPPRSIKGALHEFVFPPQEVRLAHAISQTTVDTQGAVLRKERKVHEYDQALVRGHLRIGYDDSRDHISFTVTDVLPASDLNKDILLALTLANLPLSSK